MVQKRLSELAVIIAGQSPDSSSYNKNGNGIPFFQGKADFKDIYPSEKVWCTDPKIISLQKDVLISVRAPVGAVNINRKESCIGRGLTAIRCNDQLHYRYLFWYLKSIENQWQRLIKGSTFESINQTGIKEIYIPYIDFEEQEKVAYILDKIYELKNNKKNSITLIDELLKSYFYLKFGNPYKNEKNWKVKRLIEVTYNITDGKHGDCDNQPNSGYYFISAKDLKDGKIYYQNARQITREDYTEVNKRVNLQLNDVLMSNSGTIGRIAIADDEEKISRTTFQKSVAILKVNQESIDPYFLKYSLEYKAEYIRQKASGSSQKNLLLKDIRNIEIMVPPLRDQKSFRVFLKKYHVLKKKLVASSKQIESLLNTSLILAYKGYIKFNKNKAAELKEDIKTYANEDFTSVHKLSQISEPKEEPSDFDLTNMIKEMYQNNYFSFDELWSKVMERIENLDYEILKNEFFLLLESENIIQFFDEKKMCINFQLKLK